MGVAGAGQILEMIEYQVGSIGEKLNPAIGVKGVQHAVIAAGVKDSVRKHRRGMHDIAQAGKTVPEDPAVLHFLAGVAP